MIVSAAVKVRFLPCVTIEDEIIYPCWRHRHIKEMLEKKYKDTDYEIVEEGFLTDSHQYLDRRAAAIHAYECGQLIVDSETELIEILMSEDLW